MCKCKEIYEQKLTEKFRAQAPANESNHRAELTGYGLVFQDINDTFTLKPTMTVEIKYNRTNKAGVSVAKTAKSTLIANFCPFCGKAIKETEATEGAAA